MSARRLKRSCLPRQPCCRTAARPSPRERVSSWWIVSLQAEACGAAQGEVVCPPSGCLFLSLLSHRSHLLVGFITRGRSGCCCSVTVCCVLSHGLKEKQEPSRQERGERALSVTTETGEQLFITTTTPAAAHEQDINLHRTDEN